MMDRLNTSDQRRSDRISYFDHLAYFRMTAPPFSVAVHRAVAPSDGHMPSWPTGRRPSDARLHRAGTNHWSDADVQPQEKRTTDGRAER
jgi:hypothetical protein